MTDGSHSLFEGIVIPEKKGAGFLSLQLPGFLSLHILLGVARPPYSPGKGECANLPFYSPMMQDNQT